MQSNKNPNTPKQSGFVLIPVVLTITLVAILAFLINQETTISVNMQAGGTQSTQARYTAEAGLQHALWNVQQANCSGYSDLTDIPFSDFLYSAAITPTGGSPVSISVTSMHTNETNHAINRDRVKIYQFPVQQAVLQPDVDNGKDTYLYKWKKTWNYGLSTALWVQNEWADSLAYSLLYFDVSAIPSKAKIVNAKLELWQSAPSANGGTVGVRPILSDWIEGIKTGGIGSANWNDRDSGVAWTSPGGDYSSTADVSTNIPAATVGWYQWDISNLVSDWISGTQVNRGFTLIPESVDTSVKFNSSDSTDPTLHPKLTITYTCECGIPCNTLCNANYIPTTNAGEFSTTAYGSTNIKGITFFSEGKTFNGTISPIGGAWISVDSGDDTIKMTDLAGTLLTSYSTPGSTPTGISFINSGAFSDHLAISDFFGQGIDIIDLNGSTVSSISTSALGAANPVDVAFIGSTESGTYDEMLAVLTVDGFIYIINQSGTLQVSLDLSGSTSQVEGIVHLPGKDLLMVADRGLDQSLIIDFAGNLVNSYPIATLGSTNAYAITVNPETCEHVLGDLGVDKVITLSE